MMPYPVVEYAIILDWKLWIDDIYFKGQKDVKAKIINLFDQAIGSRRNIVIAIASPIP